MRLRSWQLVLLGVLAQAGVGLWFLSGGSAPPASASGIVLSFLGGGIVLLAVVTGFVVLPVTVLLHRLGRGGAAAVVTALVGALFLVAGAGSPVFWALPVCFFGAAALSWRERAAG